jgi:hypothetical protein
MFRLDDILPPDLPVGLRIAGDDLNGYGLHTPLTAIE